MKRIVTTLILLLLLLSSISAQDQESTKGNLHRDFPNVQLIKPSIPPWHFNFDLDCWEQDHELPLAEAVPAFTAIHIRLLSRLKAKRIRHKRIRRHRNPEQPSR